MVDTSFIYNIIIPMFISIGILTTIVSIYLWLRAEKEDKRNNITIHIKKKKSLFDRFKQK